MLLLEAELELAQLLEVHILAREAAAKVLGPRLDQLAPADALLGHEQKELEVGGAGLVAARRRRSVSQDRDPERDSRNEKQDKKKRGKAIGKASLEKLTPRSL